MNGQQVRPSIGCIVCIQFGVLKCGFILPSCSDRIQLPDYLQLCSFIGRASVAPKHYDPEEHVKVVSSVASSPKNTSGVIFSGIINGPCHKFQESNTWRGQFLSEFAGVIHSRSSAKDVA